MVKAKVFEIYDNGSVPFLAKVVGNTISVFKKPNGVDLPDEESWYDQLESVYSDDLKLRRAVSQKMMEQYSELVWSCSNTNRIWVGKDWDLSEGVHGNSLLIETKPLHYVELGDSIFSFTTQEPVTHYFSNMGNSGVPYPVAVTDTSFLLMSSHTSVSKKDVKARALPARTKAEQADLDATISAYDFQTQSSQKKNRKSSIDAKKELPRTKLQNYRLIHPRI